MGPIRRRNKRKDPFFDEDEKTGKDWWDFFSPRIQGPVYTSKGSNTFESIFKISRKTFDYICSLVREDLIVKKFTFFDGKILSVNDQVAIALQRLSSGESLLNIGQSFGINHSTVSQLTWKFVETMEERALHHLHWPNTESELESIKSKFQKLQGLPNCCGAIDTTHVMMCMPTSQDSENKVWRDYANKHSMILQAIVDPDMKFRDVVTGWPGSMDDYTVLRNSGFFKLCQKGKRLKPELGEYIIGDEAFPLLPWLVTPYRETEVTDNEAEFNRRHKGTIMVAERALAQFKDRWRIIRGEMWRPDKHRLPRIILVCCLLHNIIIELEGSDAKEEEIAALSRPRFHDESCYVQQTCDYVDEDGRVLRDKLRRY